MLMMHELDCAIIYSFTRVLLHYSVSRLEASLFSVRLLDAFNMVTVVLNKFLWRSKATMAVIRTMQTMIIISLTQIQNHKLQKHGHAIVESETANAHWFHMCKCLQFRLVGLDSKFQSGTHFDVFINADVSLHFVLYDCLTSGGASTIAGWPRSHCESNS